MTQISAAKPPKPVTILSGFLGSGKTTVLNALLQAPHDRRMAVIVNEFGEVGIDGALVTGGDRFVELDNGCLCCALNEDLQGLLEELAVRDDIDHILIETTGLADPTPVAWTCTRPQVSHKLRVDAIVVVADVAHLQRTLGESEEARLQLRRADLLLMTKLDLIADGGDEAKRLLREHNELAPILAWSINEPPWRLVLGLEGNTAPRPTAEWQHETHTHAHAHPSAMHSYSHIFAPQCVLDERRVEDVALEIPESVYRFKALVRVDAAEGPYLLVNGVAGRLDLRFLQPVGPVRASTWVFFGTALPIEELKARMQALIASDGPG